LLAGAAASIALLLLSPIFQKYFPSQQYLPGLLCGSLFSLYFLYSGSNTTTPSIHKTEWRQFKLVEKRQISPNTAIYKFKLPSDNHVLGLPIGQHISIGATIGGKEIVRSYTPISSDDDKGFFELLIKTYPTGNISKYLDKLKTGDSIRVKGPKGQMVYSSNLAKEIGMIAGGTGITPMLQIIKAVLKNPEDQTKIHLVFANVAESDILCKGELEKLAKDERFDVYFVLNSPPKDFQGGVGFVTKEMIEERFGTYNSDKKVLLCGPPPMIKAMNGYLEEIGYPKSNVISKLPDAVFKF